MTLIDCGSGVQLERAVPLRMRDGTTLVSDHYYPAQKGPHPTLLMRQPYGRDIASTVVYAHPVWYARHGYNIVIQDVRGRGDSQGDFYPFRNEAHDGSDTIARLCERPESNGRIGMYGFSYQGMTQWLAAAEQPAGLIAIAPAQTAHDLFRGWFYQNRALRLASTLGWGLQMLKADARRLQLDDASAKLEQAWKNLPAQYLETPYGSHPAIHGEALPTYVRDWLEHDTPGTFWTAMDISQAMHRIRIPALHLAGWHDTYLNGSIAGFLAAREGAAPEARDHQHLVVGPWQHIPWGDRVGPVRYGQPAARSTDRIHLAWFDRWLKEDGQAAHPTGDAATPPPAAWPRIQYFVLNENTWRTAPEWPQTPSQPGGQTHVAAADVAAADIPAADIAAMDARAADAAAAARHCRHLYIRSDGLANSANGDGELSPCPPPHDEPYDILCYDPEVPVPAPGGLINAPGAFDQGALEQGNNVLVYTSGVLETATCVFGHPRVVLFVQSSASHADITAKLVRVTPGGEAIFVSLGILRGEQIPDLPTVFRFDLDPVCYLFQPGDRFRLEVASSAYPLFDRNPSTPIAPRLASPSNWSRSTQFLLHTPRFLSTLTLPVTPLDEAGSPSQPDAGPAREEGRRA